MNAANRMCLSKRRWGRRDRAERALALAQAGGRICAVYRCPMCSGWHMTSREREKSDLEQLDDDERQENFSGKFDDF